MLWRSDCQTRDRKAAGTKESWRHRFETFFGIAVKGFVRNSRWRIINAMELNVSFINQVRVFLLFFLNLFILRGMALRFRVFFSSAY